MKKNKAGSYAFLMPSLAIFMLFLFYPFFKTIYLSLFKTDKMGQPKVFVGIQNYSELFTSKSFYNSLIVTIIFVVIVVVVSMALGLLSAVFGISMLNSIDGQSITMMIAGVIMIIVPSLLIFIFGQKQLIRGMFSGAVKG